LILRVVILICILYVITVLFSVSHKKSTLKIKEKIPKMTFEAKKMIFDLDLRSRSIFLFDLDRILDPF
jgi:hypothetical protein